MIHEAQEHVGSMRRFVKFAQLLAVMLALTTAVMFAGIALFGAGSAFAAAQKEWRIWVYVNGTLEDPIIYDVEDGDEFILPECPVSREGYEFVGWIVSEPGDSLEILAPGSAIVPRKSGDVFAVWRLTGEAGGHTLTLLSNLPNCLILNGETICAVGPFVFQEGDAIVVTAHIIGDGIGLYSVDAAGIDIGQHDSLEYLYDRDGDNVDATYPYPGIRFDMPDHDVTITVLYHYGERTVTFDANGGTGEMEPMVFRSDTLTLPECTFIPPEGKVFDAWLLPFKASSVCPPGYSFSFIAKELVIRALWKDAPVHEHKLAHVAPLDATCEGKGHSGYWRCEECGKLFADAQGTEEIAEPEEIAALGHDWGAWKVTKEPTAAEDGQQMRTCKRDSSHVEYAPICAAGASEEQAQRQSGDRAEPGEIVDDSTADDQSATPAEDRDGSQERPKAGVLVACILGVAGIIGIVGSLFARTRNRRKL